MRNAGDVELLPLVDRADFLDCFRKARRAYPAGRDIHMICDNLSAHRAPPVQKWLRFTPTCSSWISRQVERWFAELQRRWVPVPQ